jgi:hypothetical protein
MTSIKKRWMECTEKFKKPAEEDSSRSLLLKFHGFENVHLK